MGEKSKTILTRGSIYRFENYIKFNISTRHQALNTNFKSMKNFLIAFLLLCYHFSISQCWEPIDTGIPAHEADIISISFINDSIGWAAGNWGYVIKTVDQGSNWEVVYHNPADFFITAIHFFDTLNGLSIKVRNNEIAQTVDGGKTWTTIKQFVYTPLWLKFINERTGWVSGQAILEKTTNSGTSWNRKNFVADLILTYSEPFFLTEKIGFVGVSDRNIDSRFFKTIDGGDTWIEIKNTPSEGALVKCYFINENIGWVLKHHALYKTVDGGDTWTKQLENDLFSSIVFFDEKNGWVSGSSRTIYKTFDGGENWIHQSSGLKFQSNSLSFNKSGSSGWGVLTPIDVFGSERLIRYKPSETFCDLDIKHEVIDTESNKKFPIFSWRLNSGCVDGYKIRLGLTQNGDELLNDKILSPFDTSFTVDFTLPQNTLIYFSVHPLNAIENNLECNSATFDTKKLNLELSNELKIYPNPTNGFLSIIWKKFEAENVELIIFDELGKVIWTANSRDLQTVNAQKIEFNLSSFESGVYFVQLKAPTETLTRKIFSTKIF